MKAKPEAPVPKLDRLLEYLSKVFDDYPYHESKDPKYFDRLIEEFSDLDIEEELKQYHSWILDQHPSKKIYYRSRFRSWLKTSRLFKEKPKETTPHWLRSRYAKACPRIL